ncbi:ABC transporter permease [Arenicella chitinivorans]|uniref:ABC transporter permease n=1 Tax=Arenicella chitinivorans TaxID=1329800 RepID=A0A918RWM1_9GAMM|nr:FtsX-like permease family protein [Arenicella chitinivorans]GHA13808.1 ABC transporter permease [Arenicella chitinivorans]
MLTLKLAWRNLWRHKRRTWLTAMAMIFSNMLLVFSISLQLGQYDMMIGNTLKMFSGNLQIQQQGYLDAPKLDRTVSDINTLVSSLRQRTPYRYAARASTFALASSQERTFGIQITGVEPEFEPQVTALSGLVSEGRYLNSSSAPEIVLGKVMAKNLKVSLGDEVTLLGSGKDGSFAAGIVTVAGIFDSGLSDADRAMALVGLNYFQETFAMRGDGHSIVVSLDTLEGDVDATQQIRQQLALLADQESKLKVHNWRALNPGLEQAIQADFTSAWFMYGVLILLVALGVMNTQLMSVLERTREFGVVMSLGVKPRMISALVMLESLLMGMLGLVIGVAFGGLIVLYFQHVGLYFPGMEEMAQRFNLPGRLYPEISVLSVLMGPVVVMMFSLVATLYPALRILRLHPVEAMRAT